MSDIITSLYSVGENQWADWLGGAVEYKSALLLDDLCDAVGGCNMLSIDCGDEMFVVMIAPHTIRFDALLCLRLSSRYDGDTLWKVNNFSTVPCWARVAQDEPSQLAAALVDFLALFDREDNE